MHTHTHTYAHRHAHGTCALYILWIKSVVRVMVVIKMCAIQKFFQYFYVLNP